MLSQPDGDEVRLSILAAADRDPLRRRDGNIFTRGSANFVQLTHASRPGLTLQYHSFRVSQHAAAGAH
jgi:hypothetical protein